MWRKYRLGNGLRGHCQIKARSIKEAWDKGCERFNKCVPTTSRRGRCVTLEVYDETILPMFRTHWKIQQDKLPPKQRYFSNHEVNACRGWTPVAEGMSKQKLIIPKNS